MPGERVLVPVSDSPTLRQTVGYAVETALERATPAEPASIRFVFVHALEVYDRSERARRRKEAADDLLSRVLVWAEEDAGDRFDELTVGTEQLGTETYIFSPTEVASTLQQAADRHGSDRIVLDPEYDPGIGAPLLREFETELAGQTDIAIETAPVERRTRRWPLLHRATPVSVGALFGVSFVFYQILSGAFVPFDVVTGTVSATIVAVGLARVSMTNGPDWQSPMRLLRLVVYIPYLLYEIIKANILVSAAILHPRMPIDPRMTRIRAAVYGQLPVTTLANSITLTPGTLTVRVQGQYLVVHTLVRDARDGLFDGDLERAVRFVFYGRSAMRVPSLRERGDAENLQPAPGERGSDGDTDQDAHEEGGESG